MVLEEKNRQINKTIQHIETDPNIFGNIECGLHLNSRGKINFKNVAGELISLWKGEEGKANPPYFTPSTKRNDICIKNFNIKT